MMFYNKGMRNASVILFWSAFALFLGSFLVSLANYSHLFQQQGVEFSPPIGSREILWQMISAALNGWNIALLPFFGAALLWTLERKLPNAGGAE